METENIKYKVNIRKELIAKDIKSPVVRENYLNFLREFSMGNCRKQIHTLDIGEDFSLIVKYSENSLYIVSIVDSSFARFLAETSIIDCSSGKIKTTLIYHDSLYNRDSLYTLNLSHVVSILNGNMPKTSEDIHHHNYYRDNRCEAIEVIDHKLHGSKPGADLKTYDEFINFIRTDLLNVDFNTFERILEDIKTLIKLYPTKSGIFLKNVSLKETSLKNIKDNLDNHIEVSYR